MRDLHSGWLRAGKIGSAIYKFSGRNRNLREISKSRSKLVSLETCTIKNITDYGLHSKLVCLSKSGDLTTKKLSISH